MLVLMTFVLILGLFFSLFCAFIAAFGAQPSWQKYIEDSLLALPTLFVIYLLWWNRVRLDRLAGIDLLKNELFHGQNTSRT